MHFARARAVLPLLFVVALATPLLAQTDRNFTVNLATDVGDGDIGDGFCNTNGAINNNSLCTLRAAIQEVSANPPATLHSIEFSVASITLTTGLPSINQPTVIDGSFGSPRVQINGNGFGCFVASSGPGSGAGNAILPEANNTRFEHLVVRGCNGVGIDLRGHGYVIYDSYIGVNAAGTAASANTGDGIDVSASILDGPIPDLTGVPLPGALADLPAIAAFLVANAGSVAPTAIVDNVISGNGGHGIYVHGQHTATTVIFNNKIGVNAAGDAAIPNGTEPTSGHHGILLSANTYMNFIGLDNIIAGHSTDLFADGINISTGSVPFPNFILGNTIGASPNTTIPFGTDLGNRLAGIRIGECRPTTAADVSSDPNTVVNPVGMSVIVGPGNIVGYNGEDNCGDTNFNCIEGGILSSNDLSRGIRIFGNLVGISEPTGLFVDIGNKGDGINIVGDEIEIGGGTLLEGNVIGSNNRHGLVVRGFGNTTDVTVRANGIGTLRGLEADFGNDGHGIWLLAGGNQFGGPAYANERNSIAFNGMHAVKIEGNGTYGNIFQQNEIFETAAGFMAIDLDQDENDPDATTNAAVTDRTSATWVYANWQQNTVTLSSASSSGVTWELRSARQTAGDPPYRIEFYSSPTPNSAKVFLCEVAALTTNPDPDDVADPLKGYATGIAGCAGASSGSFITASVTDIKPTVAGEPDRPGSGGADVPINNTSEFSASIVVPDEVRFTSATFSAAEGDGTLTVTVERVGSGAGQVAVDVVDLLTGTALAGTDYTAFSSATLNWADTELGNRTVNITLTSDNFDEADETIALQLQNVSGAQIATPSNATATITDDDNTASFSVDDQPVTEGTNPTITFTVTKTNATSFATSVNYAVTPGSATTPGDYTASDALTGTLNFASNETTKTVTLNITNDSVFEPSPETFTITLNTPVNAAIGDGSGTGSITDDETMPTMSIADVSAFETNAGTTTFTFNVTLSGASSQTITVNYATADISATDANNDYEPTSGTLTFLANDVLEAISVTVNGDPTDEGDEQFRVGLSVISGATFADDEALGTIQNDDATTPTFTIDNVLLAEGNAGTTSFTFTVSLSPPAGAPVSVQAATADGTATVADGDYTANTQTLNFNTGETSKMFTVLVNGDLKFEPDETFAVNLSLNSGGTAISGSGTGTIDNDDSQPQISIDDVSLNEGLAGVTPFVFNVTLSNPSSEIVSVNFTTADVSATTADNDYELVSGTLTFNPGVTLQQISVDVNGDATDEGDQTFNVNLTLPVNATTADNQGVGTILNDDGALPTFTIDSVTANEGNAATTQFTFTVTLSEPMQIPVSVQATTSDGTATTADSDYAAKTETLNFGVGETSKQFVVDVTGDLKFESGETFTVTLSANTAGTAIGGPGTGTISNDDAVPTIAIDDVTLNEGNAATTPFTFNVTLSNPSAQTITVNYTTANNSAAAGSDYASTSGMLTFNPGITSQPIVVNVTGDLTNEPDETFFVDLSIATNSSISDPQGVGTITNDDPVPSIQIDDVSTFELNAGINSYTFSVTLSNPSSQVITVNFATADNTATLANNDYELASGMLTFNPGITSQEIVVSVNGDPDNEPNETFFVNLSGQTNSSILDAQGVGTITNDDSTTPTFTVDSVSQNEGNAGTTTYTFTVTLTPAAAAPVSVQATTADGSATTADGDYVANTQTLNFNTGDTTETFTVDVTGDLKFEPNETFSVNLSANSVGTAIGGSGTGTLVNDDAVPSISIDDVSLLEGNAGVTPFSFTVTLSNPSSQTITVNYATADGGATIADNDYAIGAGTLTFNPGVVSQPLVINVNGDPTDELNETFFVNLSGQSNASIGDGSGTGTIQNDDSLTPTFTVSSVALAEGNAGTTPFVFTVTLTPGAASQVTVQATAVDGTATIADADFAANTQTLTFNTGETSKQFTVNVNGDTKFEPNETFSVNLSANSPGTAIGGSGTGTINNDDSQPTIGINDLSLFEGNAGTTSFTFTVSLSNASSQTVTVNWSAADGTATVADADYAPASGIVTFNPGVVTQQVTVLVNGDVVEETDETFNVNLTTAVSATILDAQGVGTIRNDDGAGVVIPVMGGRELFMLAMVLMALAMMAMKRA